MSEADIIRAAARGERAAFEQLYDAHWKAVYSYAWLLTRAVSDAEDITQESFLALMRKPKSFDPARAQLRTWLIAVVRRQHWSRSRNSSRESVALEDDYPQDVAGVEEEMIGLERAEAVRRAVSSLPELQREALYLFEFEGLSLSAIAEILEIEVNALKARLYRGRERLKYLLAPLNTKGRK